jgi:hypothetical protein
MHSFLIDYVLKRLLKTSSIWVPLNLVLFFAFNLSYTVAEDILVRNPSEYLRAEQLKRFFVPDTPDEESAALLPDVPKLENFSQYEISGTSGVKFYADISSLSISEDGIIRVALATSSASGAWSLTYEGFRCDNSEYEYRIYGTSRGFGNEWVKNRRSKWNFAKSSDTMRMRSDLVRYYLCLSGSSNGLKDISRRLEKGRSIAPRR